jgi:ethanolamine-phosphate cytidylyltransferase
VHNDPDITRHKGPPVMSEGERYAAVRACKWVDEVVEAAPYITDLAVMDRHGCQICVHGDDAVLTASGEDPYLAVKLAGRYRECRRTAGISTTDLVGRMLLMTKEHHQHLEQTDAATPLEQFARSPYTVGLNRLLPTTGKLVQFAAGAREPTPQDRIVYVDGAFDLFHVGHIDFLRRVKETLGTYLVVGVHDDAVINRIKGQNWPIMNVFERVLGVMSCRYVDEVVIGAPYAVTDQILGAYPVQTVAHGAGPVHPDLQGLDPYRLARERGLYVQLAAGEFDDFSVNSVLERIIRHREAYLERNRKKEQRELQHLQQTAN